MKNSLDACIIIIIDDDMSDESNNLLMCANCGKGEEDNCKLKLCTACKSEKYCSKDCQIAHRPMHKKACKKRVAELFDAALFKEPLSREDCPICFLPLPIDMNKVNFQACCGKLICMGCIDTMILSGGVVDACAFCRTPPAESDEEQYNRMEMLAERGNSYAFNALAGYYENGSRGMPQDLEMAYDLWLKAGELGCGEAYDNLGINYENGIGVAIDTKKAKPMFAAMNGSVRARFKLGGLEFKAGNIRRGIKHSILTAKAGHDCALENVKRAYMQGIVTKDEFAQT